MWAWYGVVQSCDRGPVTLLKGNTVTVGQHLGKIESCMEAQDTWRCPTQAISHARIPASCIMEVRLDIAERGTAML